MTVARIGATGTVGPGIVESSLARQAKMASRGTPQWEAEHFEELRAGGRP